MSKYVGRVGALAIALGIGASLFDTTAVARADDSPSTDNATTVDSDTRRSDARRGPERSGSVSPTRSSRPARSATAPAGAAASAPDIIRNDRAASVPARLNPTAPATTFATTKAANQSSTPHGSTELNPAPIANPEATEEIDSPTTESQSPTRYRDHPHRSDLRGTATAPDVLQPLKICACKLVLRALESIGQVVGGGGENGGAPVTPPLENPVLAAVAAWVRREVDQIMAIPGVAQVALAVNVKVTEISTTLIDRLTIATQEVVKCANPTEDVALPADLDRTVIASGLDQPTDFRFLPDGRILVVEKTGGVKILENTSQLNTPITAGVIGAATDRELGAVELDPNFDDNGYFYVAYTTTDYHDRLSRFTLANDVMDPASEFVLIDEADSGAMHHGNTMLFGPDGKLYWGFGDNALNTNGQDLSTIYGKILRINPDGTIPEDNPFYATPGARKEVYAYGFRNPFRMTFTPTGELLVGDVGDQAWEELNNVVAGGNYGWPSAEGSCSDCGYVNAVYEYPHTPPPGRAGSITTVTVYSGTSLPELYQNKVFVSDYTLRWMKVLTFDPTYTTVLDEQTIDTDAGTAVQLLQGPDGNLYQLNIFPGTLYRIAASGGNRAPSATLTASPPNGLSPLTVQFSSAGSTDPDAGTTLSYVWDFGDGAASTEPNPTRTYTVNGNYTVTLIVSDGEKTGTASQNIIVGSTAPNVQILTPVDESRYNAGNTISFSAMATDPEDGELPDSAYRWTVIFHHADHIHPYQDNIVGPTGTVTLSTSEHNVDTTWYEFAVTVTDTSGLSTTRSTSIKPNLVALTFAGSETGATYTIDGIPHSGIHTEQAVVGVVRDLDVPSPQVVNGAKLTFNNWSDGGTKQHQISTPATDTTYTVTFDRTSLLA